MNDRLLFRLYILALLVVGATAVAQAQQATNNSPATGHTRLTASESLWTRRFSDCDLRYYVLIPSGFVAHANRPPRPIHSVLFGLPDTGTNDVVTVEDERFISVRAIANTLEFKSLAEFSDHVLDYLRQGKSGFEVKVRQASRLDGQSAVRLRVEYDGVSDRVIHEELLSQRLGILYEIGMRTAAGHYDDDERKFSKIVEGFRFWKNYRCYGTNNNP